MTKPTTDRKPLRAILALIALATDLPMPTSFNVYDAWSLSLSFLSVDDGVAWATHFGVRVEPYTNTDGKRYLGASNANWHGWSIQMNASDPIAGTDAWLDEDTAAALAAIADQREDVTKK